MGEHVTAPPPTALPADVAAALGRLLSLVDAAKPELRALTSRSGSPATGAPDEIAEWLYARWYTAPAGGTAAAATLPGRRDLRSALRAALPASERWQADWIATQTRESGACAAGRRGQTRVVLPGDYVNVARPGLPVAPGDRVAVTERIDWVDEPSGFWCVQSAAGAPESPLARVYWNVPAESIATVLRAVAAMLDARVMRYTLKCPVRASDYARVDSLVVYVQRAALPEIDEALHATAETLASHVRAGTPPLTRAVARGVAAAEDPGTQRSFGQSRCDALASGVRTLVSGVSGATPDGWTTLVAALRAAGVDPRRPWSASPP